MELRHLRYFIAVAEELHFGRAARRLAISQPPLSQQILALETELEVKLFDRSRRQVRLTRAGAVFLSSAREILAAVDHATLQAREAHQGQTGTLRVAHIAGATLTLVPAAVNRHRKRFPRVTLDCQMVETTDAHPALLRSGAVDLGIVRLPLAAGDLVVKDLGAEPMVLAVPTSFALARRREVDWKDLRDVPFVAFPRLAAPELHDEITAIMARRGLIRQVAIEAPHFLTMLAYVAAGLGVCLVIESAAALQREGVTYVRVRRPLLVRTGVAYRPENDVGLVRQFVTTLRECFRELHPVPARRRSGSSSVTDR
jgi:DNA-binding transcriptional LysR family regulator